MPGRWVTRKDLNGLVRGKPLPCFVAHAIVAEPGVRTVEQCVQDLLDEGEEAQGDADSRRVVKEGRVVGYIEIRHRMT